MTRCNKQHGPHIQPSEAGKPWSEDQCRLCWRELNAAPPPAHRHAQASAPCRHLGPPTGERVACPTCRGIELKLMGCSVHGDCTPAKPAPGHACCRGCPDYSPFAADERAILLTGGIGDAFALEGMMRPEEREQLSAIYYACPAAREISDLFAALPNYPKLRRHILLPSAKKVHYSQASVEADHGALPAAVEDWSVLRQFQRRRAYAGSSFLTHRLARPRTSLGEYVAIVPASQKFGRWADRDFSAADWSVCIGFLESWGLSGVVLGSESAPLPQGPLTDLRGKISILESIEVLKGARGYLGIDSCLSVLAAKLFPVSRLSVKSVSGHLYQWSATYYAPRTEFGFVARQLEAPSWT